MGWNIVKENIKYTKENVYLFIHNIIHNMVCVINIALHSNLRRIGRNCSIFFLNLPGELLKASYVLYFFFFSRLYVIHLNVSNICTGIVLWFTEHNHQLMESSNHALEEALQGGS